MTRDRAISEIEACAIKEKQVLDNNDNWNVSDSYYLDGYLDGLKVVKDILTETDKKILAIIK